MATGTLERIPESIQRNLDPRYSTDYHLYGFTPGGWHHLTQLNYVEAIVAFEATGLLKSDQGWQPEAIAIFWDVIQEEERQRALITMRVVLQTDNQVPTRTSWVPFFPAPKFLDLNQVVVPLKEPQPREQRSGLKHEISIRSHLPKLGPFGPWRDIETSEVPYFITGIDLSPFYYYKKGGERLIAGECLSRVVVGIDLEDGRETLAAKMEERTRSHDMQLADARLTLAASSLRVEKLQEASLTLNLVDSHLLRALDSRPDPFMH